ncbi:MAG: polyphenol oxidase family protein, partial [Chloroflexota bacterium]
MTFASFEAAGVAHALFTRQGGVSPQPWASLNLGRTVGDAPENVLENRRRAFATLDRPFESLFDVWQVHSKDVVCTDRPRRPDETHLRADAILTDRPGVTLFMRFADCVPVLLFDPRRRAVGLVHAGWQGTVSGVVGEAVAALQARYGSQPGDLLAGIGPSICQAHYEVGKEVIEQVQRAFGERAGELLAQQAEPAAGHTGVHLDLWRANRLALERAGV